MLNLSLDTVKFNHVMLKKMFFVLVDIILINLATIVALLLKFGGTIPGGELHKYSMSFVWITIINLIIFYIFRLYHCIWKYASIDELLQVFMATALGSLLVIVIAHSTHTLLDPTIYFISWSFKFIFVGGSRISYRFLRRAKNFIIRKKSPLKRTMIIGAGQTGANIIRQFKLNKTSKNKPVVIVDDNYKTHGSQIYGVNVIGDRNDIIRLVDKYKIEEIVMAISKANSIDIKEIIEICIKTKCKVKIVPQIDDMMKDLHKNDEYMHNNDGKNIIMNNLDTENKQQDLHKTDEEIDIFKIRDVRIEDLLGRKEIVLNTSEISDYITNEVILVTGGGGSIGSEICRQIAKFNPKMLIVLDIYENNAYDLQMELQRKYKDKLNIKVLIGSVRDRNRLDEIFDTYRPGVVFHAAAHKHVPLMEDSPAEAIKNNVFGTLNVTEYADKYGVKKFVLISTDKAVNPTNIMGASKRVAEMIIQNASRHSKTEFVAVRFGNVLGSNGSVIPLFKKQIEQGGPVTITHPDITRFFMTIPEASRLVMQAGGIAKGGEIFVLDMGTPVKIVDLATDLIKLSGLEPDVDIKIEFVGLRPGEKLYEELLLAEEGIKATKHEKIFIEKPMHIDSKLLMNEINGLKTILSGDTNKVIDFIERVVPTYCKVV